jgi:hypothetical protein
MTCYVCWWWWWWPPPWFLRRARRLTPIKACSPTSPASSFRATVYTTRESVQVYWLYRCAELALEKGFAGFEILSDMHFVTRRPPLDDTARSPLRSTVASLRTRIPVSPDEVADTAAWVDQADLTSRSAEPIRMAHGGTFMYYAGGVSAPMASIEGDVHFLAGPVQSAPPKVFNA